MNKFLNFVTLYFRYSCLLNGNKLRVHTDAMAQHFVQCQFCPENTQFFCKPCEVRLCEGCVGIHLQKKSPEAHQFIHYHNLWKNRKLMSEPEVVSIVTCPYTSMLDIARWGECNFYVCSTLSRHIHKFDFRKNEGVDNSLAPGWPRRLATFGDDIIFTERNENDVKILTKNGEFQTLFSTADWNARGIGCTASGHIILGLQKLNTGKVAIFDKAGRVLKEIVHNKQGSALYSNPYYVIESTNGDLCAADIVLAAVVVVDSDGGFKFTYTGNPSGDGRFDPHGIAADSLSNLVIADWITRQLHLINENGHFLRYFDFFPNTDMSESPTGLCIDSQDLLFVCSYDSDKVKVMKYLH